jgi:hypothetical protein
MCLAAQTRRPHGVRTCGRRDSLLSFSGVRTHCCPGSLVRFGWSNLCGCTSDSAWSGGIIYCVHRGWPRWKGSQVAWLRKVTDSGDPHGNCEAGSCVDTLQNPDLPPEKRDGPAHPWYTPIAIIERATMPDQRTVFSTLRDVGAALESVGEQRPPGMIVVGWSVLCLWKQGDVSVLDLWWRRS